MESREGPSRLVYDHFSLCPHFIRFAWTSGARTSVLQSHENAHPSYLCTAFMYIYVGLIFMDLCVPGIF